MTNFKLIDNSGESLTNLIEYNGKYYVAEGNWVGSPFPNIIMEEVCYLTLYSIPEGEVPENLSDVDTDDLEQVAVTSLSMSDMDSEYGDCGPYWPSDRAIQGLIEHYQRTLVVTQVCPDFKHILIINDTYVIIEEDWRYHCCDLRASVLVDNNDTPVDPSEVQLTINELRFIDRIYNDQRGPLEMLHWEHICDMSIDSEDVYATIDGFDPYEDELTPDMVNLDYAEFIDKIRNS